MNVNTMFPSKYLKKEDAETPIRAVVAGIVVENVGRQDSPDQKPVIQFNGNVKPLVLNKRNAKVMANAWGEDTNAWMGKTIEIYCDPNVEFAGEVVGGLRVRIPAAITVWQWAQAVTEVKKVGATEDELKAYIRAAGFNGYRPDRDTALVQMFVRTRTQQETRFDDEPDGPDIGGPEIPF